MNNSTTLRDVAGLGHKAASLKDAALIMVDCQNTYRRGVMQLTGVEQALVEARQLLEMARDLKTPIFHIQHDAGAGSPYDISADIGAIAEQVAPRAGEPVVVKNYPNSFVQTDLDAQLKALGIQNLVLAGFMTHMCIRSTAEGAFNLGYAPTVVASATASRLLPGISGEDVPAQTVHMAALANIRDLFGVVVLSPSELG
jgi:nicotinamidase-related amidase